MSDEDTDLVVDDEDVLMGEVVMSESTFPAAPLVRPPVMLPPVLAHTSTCAETLITTASPSDFVRVITCEPNGRHIPCHIVAPRHCLPVPPPATFTPA